MKRIMILIGIVGMMISAVSIFSSAFASQVIGTPLYTDPGAHERIMSSPRPEGFRYGWDLPPSVDLEVEWEVIGPADVHRSIRGIFIDQDGTIRVIDICRKAMRGMRVWLSRNSGRNWKVEKSIRDAWTDRSALLGKEKGKVLFSGGGTGRKFRDWPLEVETLLKTEFRGLYEARAPGGSATLIFLAKDPNNEKIIAFAAHSAGPPGPNTRLFVTVDRGKKWIEINFTKQAAWTCGGRSVLPGGLAIKETRGRLKVFIGIKGTGPGMVQVATLSLSEIRETLAKK